MRRSPGDYVKLPAMRLPTRLRSAVGRGLGRLGTRWRSVGGGLGPLATRWRSVVGGGLGPLATPWHSAVAGGLGRALVIVAFVLAGAATAVGMSAGSSSDVAAEGPPRPAQGDAARPDLPAIAARNRVAEPRGGRPRRGGAAHYRETARKQVPAKTGAGFMPLYREAERVFGVNWRLIASIHRQETAFSTAPGTYRGLNAFGCCAGPMQFNVTNGPVSTWELYRDAFRDGRRPKSYPHRTRHHPSIYDDFDAIMAAGSLLRDSGAGPSLDFGAWSAAYSYYGHDLFGVTYASEVLARAVGWERDGFCLNCGVDEGLVAEFDITYGAPVREQLLADERRRKKRTERKEARERQEELRERRERRERRDRRKVGDGGSDDRVPARSPARRPRPSAPPSADNDAPPKPAPPPATSTQPSTTPAAPPPAPPADECSSIDKMLGC